MSNRTAVIKEMEAYGLSPIVIEALSVPDPVSVEGLLAFRQGLAEAGNGGEENPTFPEEMRRSLEYELGMSVVGLYQASREAA